MDSNSPETLYERLKSDAEENGYHLNPDLELTKDLVEGLLVNEERYGYQSCPCRLGADDKFEDLDIICPCDYRDPDINDYGSCYCGLYVSEDIFNGKQKVRIVPERRPAREERAQIKAQQEMRPKVQSAEQIADKATGQKAGSFSEGCLSLTYPVWRCRVCGYLCAREEPPGKCPICKVGKERFERFM
jgi:ferredoxin-thioredoxin reductase catalytic subunit/rubredoxin